MDSGGGSGPSLFPLHRCKTIHLVRHAQGIHNVDGDKNYKAYMNPDYFDAHLTPLGWNQVHYLRNHVRHSGLLNRIDLVIASPLLSLVISALEIKLDGELKHHLVGAFKDDSRTTSFNVRQSVNM
ncbi:phosphoglycerate mutase-like protein 1 [Cajanus cajan]|uniref:phosphoglycerate mutase-like protein 1 n=1 Tax=Cajanus cajan TaxID=3821 RepID=UPI00098DC105|nr:phosphoglycerate mutase-like protein 1 [Cajanus cajan]